MEKDLNLKKELDELLDEDISSVTEKKNLMTVILYSIIRHA